MFSKNLLSLQYLLLLYCLAWQRLQAQVKY